MLAMRQLFSGANQTLEGFVNDALTWPSNKWDEFVSQWKYRDVCKFLPKYRPQVEVVLANHLDPKKHSLAYSYLLGFKSNEKMDNDPQLAQLFTRQVEIILNHGSPSQIAIFPRPFSDAIRAYSDLNKRMQPAALINPMKRAIHVLTGGPNHAKSNSLSVAHVELVYCCVQSHMYDVALPIIEKDLIEVQGHNAVSAMEVLMYHYYAALVFIAVKQWRRAVEFLSVCLTIPSETISCIQIDAYKRYLLVGLIWKQKNPSLPRQTPKILGRYFRQFASEYQDFADYFGRPSATYTGLTKLVEKHEEVFTSDRNFGLVKQVLNKFEKYAVKKLTSVYTRLSILKVAQLCGFKDEAQAQRILISMISDGDLSASLDGVEGVVKFEEGFNETDADMLKKVHGCIDNLVHLWDNLDRAQLEIKRSPSYVKKVLNIGNEKGEMESAFQDMIPHMLGGGNFFRG